MSLEAGRIGVRRDQVDAYGRVNPNSAFITNLLNDLPAWTDLPVWKKGTEQLLPLNDDEPDTSPILCDIEYPVADLKNNQYFTYRQSPTQKDGKAKIRGIRGKTLVWNQLCKTLASGNWATVAVGTGTLTFADGVATFSTSQNFGRFLYTPGNLVNGHKYLLSIEIKAYENATINYALGSQSSYASQGCVCSTESALDANWHRYISIGTFTSGTDDKVLVQNNSGESNLHEIQVRNIMYFDLTQMGLDSITSVSEFTSLFPLSFYVRDTGSLLDFTGTKLKTTGKNLIPFPYYTSSKTENGLTFTVNDDGTILVNGTASSNTVFRLCTGIDLENGVNYILSGCPSDISGISIQEFNGAPYDTGNGATFKGFVNEGFRIRIASGTVCNKLLFKPMVRYASADSDYEVYKSNETDLPISTFFPTGMKSAGAVYDELTPTRAITRVKQIDLGSLDWSVSGTTTSGVNRFASSTIVDIKKASSNSDIVNTTCPLGVPVSPSNTYNKTEGVAVGTNGNIFVYLDAYKSYTNTQFKTAVTGVKVNYELAVEDVQPTMSFDSE